MSYLSFGDTGAFLQCDLHGLFADGILIAVRLQITVKILQELYILQKTTLSVPDSRTKWRQTLRQLS